MDLRAQKQLVLNNAKTIDVGQTQAAAETADERKESILVSTILSGALKARRGN